MSTGMQTPQNILSTFAPFGPPVLSAHGFPKRVLLASAQPFAQEFIDATPYPESAAQWLISLLNLLAGIVDQSKDLSRIVVTETEYQQTFSSAGRFESMVLVKMKPTLCRQQWHWSVCLLKRMRINTFQS